MMKIRLCLSICFCCLLIEYSYCQADTISKDEVKRIIGFLASDKMKGRGNFTPELQKAADFIANEFRRDSLRFFPGLDSYFLPFSTEHLSYEQIQKDSTGHYNH